MLSYKPLWHTLKARSIKKLELKEILSPAALKKIQHDEPFSLNMLMKICKALDVPIQEVVESRKPKRI